MKTFFINRKAVFYALLLLLALFDMTEMLPTIPSIKTLVGTSFLLLMPGLLIAMVVKLDLKDIWGRLVVILGLSIAFLLFGGFIISLVLPFFGIPQPLSFIPMICLINLVYIALMNALTFQNRLPSYTITLPHLTRRSSFFFLFPLVLPFVAAGGALLINNNQTNVLTLVMLGSIALFVTLIYVFHKRLSRHVYPHALYFISLSLLLMTSLRGWHITGHDIQPEYFVFQLTKQQYFWNMHAYRDAYNACLSITILPTILSTFTSLPDPYIYKLIFQCIFAVSPIIVFLFVKKYTSDIIAFFSAFYFLSFPTFMHDMPMLNRQEIGFLFFFLLLYVLFSDHIKQKQKRVLSMVFAGSMVVAHYSTTYIAISILGIVYGSQFILGRLRKDFGRNRYIPAHLIVLLLILTFLWNNQLTKTSNGLVETVRQTLKTINTSFQLDNKSSDVGYSIFVRHTMSTSQFITTFVQRSMSYLDTRNPNAFYQPTAYAEYKPESIPEHLAPSKPLGQALGNISIPVERMNALLRQLAAQGIQLFIGIGMLGIFFFQRRSKHYDSEYLIGCAVCMMLITLMIVLPQLSLQYGLLRLFQQSLFFLSLPLVLGSIWICRLINKRVALSITVTGAVFFFLIISGFISENTGRYYLQLNLNNAGIYYDAYYLHPAEVSSIHWLQQTMDRESPLQADALTSNKLLAIGGLFAIKTIFPQGIEKSAYVYLGDLNTKGAMVISVDQSILIKVPIPFLDAHKNLIYNNGSSRIYK